MEFERLGLAADHLGLSQPAASAALKRLRLTLKDELFIRTKRGFKPTPRAIELYPVIKQSLDAVREEIDRTAHFNPQTCKRIFKVMGGDYFDMVLMGKLMNRTRESAPYVQVESTMTSFDAAVFELTKGKLDLALHYDDALAKLLPSEKLFDDGLCVLMASNHPEVEAELNLEKYMQLDQVVLPRLRDDKNQLDTILGDYLESRRIRARVSSTSSMATTIKDSHLVGTVSQRMADILCESYDFVIKPFPVQTPQIPVYLSWANFAEKDPAHQWFRSTLIDIASSNDGF